MTEPTIRKAQIFVSDLRLTARVGVNPGEKGASQPIVVDVRVGLDDVARAAQSERLSHTIDYVGVTRAVEEVVAQRHYPLVEGLALAIAQEILKRFAAPWVKLRLSKVDCLEHASGAGVALELRRDLPAAAPVPLDPSGLDLREEVVIVGGGVAGMTAALWCHCLGHQALLVDPAPNLGGQLHMVHGRMNDLTAMRPLTGHERNRLLWRQFVEHQGRWCRAQMVNLTPTENGCRIQLLGPADREPQTTALVADTVILAMGVRRRQLGVPGETELSGKGVLDTAARQPTALADRHVVVVGGGDAACENALILARGGATVSLVHRGTELTARQMFARDVLGDPRITVRLNTEVQRFVGRECLEAVQVRSLDRPITESIAAQAALIRIGWVPNSTGLPPDWLEARGYVHCDTTGLVRGQSRIFAAGDLLGQIAPSFATAIGSGATAARAACLVLEGRST